MKSSLFLLGSLFFLASCGGSDADETEAGEEQAAATATGGNTYQVDTTQSTVQWTGYKVGGEHTGTFKISNGTITTDSSTIGAGNFTINVASITNQDQTGESKTKLESHLKGEDFFEIAKYPTARFEITKVEPYTASGDSTGKPKLQGATHYISGNLTLKDQTKHITFPARVSTSGNDLTAHADFDIDRTQWGMNYKGPNNPRDWAIKKEVNIKLNILAKK